VPDDPKVIHGGSDQRSHHGPATGLDGTTVGHRFSMGDDEESVLRQVGRTWVANGWQMTSLAVMSGG
jgi:hypothetical protein